MKKWYIAAAVGLVLAVALGVSWVRGEAAEKWIGSDVYEISIYTNKPGAARGPTIVVPPTINLTTNDFEDDGVVYWQEYVVQSNRQFIFNDPYISNAGPYTVPSRERPTISQGIQVNTGTPITLRTRNGDAFPDAATYYYAGIYPVTGSAAYYKGPTDRYIAHSTNTAVWMVCAGASISVAVTNDIQDDQESAADVLLGKWVHTDGTGTVYEASNLWRHVKKRRNGALIRNSSQTTIYLGVTTNIEAEATAIWMIPSSTYHHVSDGPLYGIVSTGRVSDIWIQEH